MKIVVAFGGLGNVMFYYALANAYRQKGVKAFVFVSKTNLEHYNYSIKEVFPQISLWGNLNCVEKVYYFIIQKIRNFRYKKYKVPHKYLFAPFTGLYYDQEPVKYIPSIFDNLEENKYLIGHFQSYKYFNEYRDAILDELQFSMDMLSEKTKMIANDMQRCNSVSIHVRRGDYLNGYYYNTLGIICDIAYYQRAIAAVKENVDDPHFYVFSDDPKYVAENLKIDNATYVDFNVGKDSWQDMFLMSRCKNNIIANSTFSWWGAWLNRNPSKIVIAPTRWFANLDEDELVLPEWTRL